MDIFPYPQGVMLTNNAEIYMLNKRILNLPASLNRGCNLQQALPGQNRDYVIPALPRESHPLSAIGDAPGMGMAALVPSSVRGVYLPLRKMLPL